MTKDPVNRDAKLNRKLRASEAERVRLARELDRTRKQLAYGVNLLKEANAEIKKLKKQADLERDVRTETESGFMKAVYDLQVEVEALKKEAGK